MKQKFKSLRLARTYKAQEKEYYKKLRNFSFKVDSSLMYWLLIAAKHKKTAKQINKEINSLKAYWNKKANNLSETLPKSFTKNIEKFINLRLSKQVSDISLKESSKIVRNEVNAILERNISLIKTIPSDIIERYRSEILNNVTNLNQEALIKSFKSFNVISQKRAKVIARDQTQKAINGLQQAKAQQLGFSYYIWHTAQDSRVSDEHKRLNGRIYSYEKPTAVIDSYGNVGHTGQRVNCLPRGQGIDITNIPLKLFKSFVAFNEATIFSISYGGKSFSVTSDHKVLTDSGWVSANALNKGDYILKTISENTFTNSINFNQHSIVLSNFFDFISELVSVSSVLSDRLTSFRVGVAGNFYENIRENEKIYIIDIECLLRDCRNIIFEKCFIHQHFPDSEMGIQIQCFISSLFSTDCHFDFFINTKSASSDFIVSGFRYLLSIINAGILKPNDIRLASISDFIIHIFKSLNDSIPATFKQISYFKNAITSDIIILNFFCVYMFIILWKCLNRYIVDNSTIPLENRKTEKVRIENIKRLKMDTHIYSLECDNGYYTIDNIINKNCRCFAEPIFLQPNQELVLKHDSKSGNYYEIRNKE